MLKVAQVFDEHVLDNLADDVGSSAVARHFAAQYLGLLQQRVERLSCALRTHDFDQAHDAVLSLKVTSATVGAGRLSDISRRIEDCVLASTFDTAVNLLAEAVEVVVQTRSAIRSYLATTT